MNIIIKYLLLCFSEKDGEPTLPSGSQSLSKATGSKLAGAGGKSGSAKSKSGVGSKFSAIYRYWSLLTSSQ